MLLYHTLKGTISELGSGRAGKTKKKCRKEKLKERKTFRRIRVHERSFRQVLLETIIV